MSKHCQVYVLSALDTGGKFTAPVKIGIGWDAKRRMTTIKTSCPIPITLTYAFTVPSRDDAQYIERIAHSTFKKFRLNGEWFQIDVHSAVAHISDIIHTMVMNGTKDEAARMRALNNAGAIQADIFCKTHWPDAYGIGEMFQ